jgi:DNA-binding MarR family transcriptional regulator
VKSSKTRFDLIDVNLRTLWQSVRRMYNKEAIKYGVTYGIGFTLLSIDPKKGTPSTSIGPIMGVEANSLSRLLKKMEIDKLIYRKPNPRDGRGVIISLTKEGLKKRDITKNKVLKFNSLIKDNITKEELNIFLKTTNTIKNLISENTVFKNK